MNTKILRQNSALLALNKYVNVTREQQRAVSNSQAITATMQDRDGTRGVLNIQLVNGGSSTAKSLTSSGIPVGAAIPATVAAGNNNYIDSRPYR